MPHSNERHIMKFGVLKNAATFVSVVKDIVMPWKAVPAHYFEELTNEDL